MVDQPVASVGNGLPKASAAVAVNAAMPPTSTEASSVEMASMERGPLVTVISASSVWVTPSIVATTRTAVSYAPAFVVAVKAPSSPIAPARGSASQRTLTGASGLP